jgi:hypothetical protein
VAAVLAAAGRQAQRHILDGQASRSSHASQFPADWQADPELIWDAIDAVLAKPGTIQWMSGHLTFYGSLRASESLFRCFDRHRAASTPPSPSTDQVLCGEGAHLHHLRTPTRTYDEFRERG